MVFLPIGAGPDGPPPGHRLPVRVPYVSGMNAPCASAPVAVPRSWFLRLVGGAPAAVAGRAAGLAAALLLLNAGVWWIVAAGGPIPDFVPTELFVFFPLGIGYGLMAAAHGMRGALADLERLGPVLACSPAERDRLATSLVFHDPRRLRLAVATGALLALAFNAASIAAVAGSFRLPPVSYPTTGVAVLLSLESIAFWAFWCTAFLVLLDNARAFGRIGAHRTRVDLLDRAELTPFARAGLRFALVVLGLVALRSSFFGFSEAAAARFAPNAVPFAVVSGVATAAFLLPVWGVHRRLADAKASELVRVRSEIAKTRGAEREEALGPDAGALRRLVDLVRYRDAIAGARTWPFDAPAILRFLVYLLIPIAGWVGGALVERALDVAIGD